MNRIPIINNRDPVPADKVVRIVLSIPMPGDKAEKVASSVNSDDCRHLRPPDSALTAQIIRQTMGMLMQGAKENIGATSHFTVVASWLAMLGLCTEHPGFSIRANVVDSNPPTNPTTPNITIE
jgi:hypothetical protein